MKRLIAILAALASFGCGRKPYSGSDYEAAAEYLVALKTPMIAFAADYGSVTNAKGAAVALGALSQKIADVEAVHPQPDRAIMSGRPDQLHPLIREASSNYWMDVQAAVGIIEELGAGTGWGADPIVKAALIRLEKRQINE